MPADPLRGHARRAVRLARSWLARSWLAREGLPETFPGSATDLGAGCLTADPGRLLRAAPEAFHLLDDVPAGPPGPDWPPLLDCLLAVAVRAHDLDALAHVLRCCGRLGLTGSELPRQAAGFLIAQQQPDGSFGGPDRADDVAAADLLDVRAALTRGAAAALEPFGQRTPAPHSSRMRKNPASRSPSTAMPGRLPS